MAQRAPAALLLVVAIACLLCDASPVPRPRPPPAKRRQPRPRSPPPRPPPPRPRPPPLRKRPPPRPSPPPPRPPPPPPEFTIPPFGWANIFPAELSRQGSFEVALMVDTADNVVIAHTEPLSQPASDKVTVRRFRPRLRGTAADKWPPLGPRGALGFAALMSLAAEPGTNAPYLSFQNIFPPRVVRFNASAGAWLDVGPNPVEQVSLLLSRTALAFDRAARPLLAFARSDDNKVVVLRFEGGAWTPLGPPGLAGGVPASLAGSLVALPDGTPLVAAEPFVQPFPAPLAFNGASWVPLGTSAQLPAILSSPSNGRGASLALDRAGLPWLAYGDASNQLVVLRFDGGAWQPVGPAPLAGPFPPDVQLLQVTLATALAFSSRNVPHLAFQMVAQPQFNGTVLRFDAASSTWAALGPEVVIPSFPTSVSSRPTVTVAFDSKDVLYAAFLDSSRTAVVYRW